jgi:drug/metabolite transporter (DMT)-like permease
VQQQQRPFLALGLRLISALTLASMLAMVKYAGRTGVALPEIMFWRQAVTIPVISLYLLTTGGLPRIKTQRLPSHARRALSGMTGMACNFGAAILLPLAVSTTLGFTTPLFAVLIGALVLGHHVGPWRWSAVILGFAGVLVITQPGHEPLPLLGTTIGLLSGFLVAIISHQLRDLGRTEDPIASTFYFALFGAPIMAVFLPFFMTSHTPMQWLILLGIGSTGTLTQLLLTMSLRYGSVASVLVMDYTLLIWSSFYGWAIWDQFPTRATFLGAPLIIGAGLLIAWREHRLMRETALLSTGPAVID